MSESGPVVVVHGGAGHVPEALRDIHEAGCRRAATAGLQVLTDGGSALDAAQRAVEVLEDDPLFNAGTGGSLTEDGTLELDASLMEGTHRTAGAVCALPPFPNPIRIARSVLEEGRHVLYAGHGAALFAEARGFVRADPEQMITEAARHRLSERRAGVVGEAWAGGTVGAVARAASGNLAAATSTGGTVGKHRGRVGDTPLLGAGTYADDAAGACSATGIGEAIMRACVAHAAVQLTGMGVTADEAARSVVTRLEERFDGMGGIILLDPMGGVGLAFNTQTMSHAVARADRPLVSGR